MVSIVTMELLVNSGGVVGGATSLRPKCSSLCEAQKFVLLPEDAAHDAVLFPSLPRGQAIDCSTVRHMLCSSRARQRAKLRGDSFSYH